MRRENVNKLFHTGAMLLRREAQLLNASHVNNVVNYHLVVQQNCALKRDKSQCMEDSCNADACVKWIDRQITRTFTSIKKQIGSEK